MFVPEGDVRKRRAKVEYVSRVLGTYVFLQELEDAVRKGEAHVSVLRK